MFHDLQDKTPTIIGEYNVLIFEASGKFRKAVAAWTTNGFNLSNDDLAAEEYVKYWEE